MLLLGGLWLLAYLVARYALESLDADRWPRVLVALLPILPAAGFLYLFISDLLALDEPHQRVQLEAFAFAFLFAILLLMILGLLGQALDLSPERHVWYYLPLCYFLGLALALARRRDH
jgi:hypothetical protein